MKKLIILFLALAIALSFAGCGASKASINGVGLKEFSIVYSAEDADYSLRAAEYIQAQVLAVTGIELPIVEDSDAPVGEYEIVVGNTDRPISERLDEQTENVQFSMLVEEKQIALEGDYFIIAAAAYYFVETYVTSKNFEAAIPLGASVHDPIVKEAKNYILLIGDGMGENHTRIFEYFENNVEYGDGEDIFYGYYLPHCR